MQNINDEFKKTIDCLRQHGIVVYDWTPGEEISDGYLFPIMAFRSQFDFSRNERLYDELTEAINERLDGDEEERIPFEKQYELVMKESQEQMMSTRLKMQTLLEEFYSMRPIIYGHELIVADHYFVYGVLQVASWHTYCLLSKEEQKKHFEACRAEFLAFGKFLATKVV
ncbi:hypothetical protein IJJ27_03310 [bacterium]|nr:hypothetical protein [bacterium]MBQ6436562.1 hypothetical protein [bacterium]